MDQQSSGMTEQAGSPILSLRGLSKTFSGQHALREVDVDLRKGEILALVGQNGSGKSTLIKVLAGYHQPDPGAEAFVDGRPFTLGDAASALDAGLRFVHQDLGLVPALDALDNLALGRGYQCNGIGQISWRREAAAARELLEFLGYGFDLRAPVSQLSASERTGLAIARALQGWEGGAKVLVLDEPTASLPADEVERVFEVVRMVQSRGVAVLYVSHHFNEVFALSDRVTVLRDGRHIDTRATADLDERQLIELTVGRSLEQYDVRSEVAESSHGGDAVLQVRGLRGRVVRDLDVTVRAGEVVGFAGLNGSGREELGNLIYGATDRLGEVEVSGRKLPRCRPDASSRAGLAFVPSERLAKAALPDMSLRENLTVGLLRPVATALGINVRTEREDATAWLNRLEVKPRDPEAVFTALSGGNQQKVVLGRNLRRKPKVLVLDDPTQGVDVGAKAAIHQVIDEAAADGMAVVVLSTESEELVRLCDRIIVMTDGRAAVSRARGEVDADGLTELTLQGARGAGPATSSEALAE